MNNTSQTINCTNTNCSICVLSPQHDPIQLSYNINALIIAIITLPAISLNVVVMRNYLRLHPTQKSRNSMFLIFNQGMMGACEIYLEYLWYGDNFCCCGFRDCFSHFASKWAVSFSFVSFQTWIFIFCSLIMSEIIFHTNVHNHYITSFKIGEKLHTTQLDIDVSRCLNYLLIIINFICSHCWSLQHNYQHRPADCW